MPNEIIVVPEPQYATRTGYGPSTEATTAPAEFDSFEALTSKLVKVPKSEVDEKREKS